MVVNPRQVRDFAKAAGKLAKTDVLDAQTLAHFAEVMRPEPRSLPDEQTQTLAAILDTPPATRRDAHGREEPARAGPQAGAQEPAGTHCLARARIGADGPRPYSRHS